MSTSRPDSRTVCNWQAGGFTLVELSIVLIIIGLIIGGVLVGRDLIVSSELKKLVSQEQRYETAFQAFRSKYNCLPGDCTNATDFFGVASAGCHGDMGANTSYILATGGTGTCNGDGNGRIVTTVTGAGTDRTEAMLVFNHLSLAGLVEGQYDGNCYACTGIGLKAGANVPTTIRNGGIDFMSYWLGDTNTAVWANAFSVGTILAVGGDYSGGGLLTPAEALMIDNKYDDGSPITGRITGNPWTGWGNATDCMASPHVGGTYDLTKTTAICGLYFQFDPG